MHSSEVADNAATDTLQRFYNEVIQGLTAIPKYLPSKYFYNARGDDFFLQIMHSTDYYLAHSELEIMAKWTDEITEMIEYEGTVIDLVELGPGDASKSIYLIETLYKNKSINRYLPVDISANVIRSLKSRLPEKLPNLEIEGYNGEYFDMLDAIGHSSPRNKVVLFLGGNIGNYSPAAAAHFCTRMREYLRAGDKILIGIDLKKHPQVILNAYNDRQGYTRAFNLNLLERMNKELNATFKLDQFDHYPTYDPGTGACKSYLVSKRDQSVHIMRRAISFEENETIFMEISQKYSVAETDILAARSGFLPLAKFFDSRKWFVDCVWKVT
jgi:dimethylhistidine N-methyltransferase